MSRWTAETDPRTGRWWVEDDSGHFIADYLGAPNAHLIAKSPEMAEWIRDVLHYAGTGSAGRSVEEWMALKGRGQKLLGEIGVDAKEER